MVVAVVASAIIAMRCNSENFGGVDNLVAAAAAAASKRSGCAELMTIAFWYIGSQKSWNQN